MSKTRVSEGREAELVENLPDMARSRNRDDSILERQRKFRTILKRVIRSEVIPRIYDVSGGPDELPPTLEAHLSDNDLAEFKNLILAEDHKDCVQFVQAKIDNGLSLRSICLGLFTLTARSLGEDWLADDLSFVEVTTGLGTLHVLVHQFSARDRNVRFAGPRHNIILASAPSEQHAFGILIVSKIFEQEGWLVTGGPDTHTGADLTSLVGKTWFDIIGLTASSEQVARSLKDEVQRLRNVSLNPSVRIIVGGNGFANHPGIFLEIGADALAADADDAVLKAEAMLEELSSGTSEDSLAI